MLLIFVCIFDYFGGKEAFEVQICQLEKQF
jgi:hypothetical protein